MGIRGFFFICATVGTGGTTILVVVCGCGGVSFICYTVGTYCLISLVIIWRKSVFFLIPCTVGTDGCHFGDCGEMECFFISYSVGYQRLSGKYKCMYPGIYLVKQTLNIKPKCSWVC